MDDSGRFVDDPTWHASVKQQFSAIAQFLRDNQLIRAGFELPPRVEDLVVQRSDLTDEGVWLFTSGAIYRWLGSFDCNPKKPLNNYTILMNALSKRRTASR